MPEILQIDDTEKDELMKRWSEVFTKITYKDFLNLRYNQYAWERLNQDNETIESPESVDTYLKQKTSELFVMKKTKNGYNLSLSLAKNLPVFPSQEVIVFPKNLAWTMIFTHEDNNREVRSPFFIKSPEYEKYRKKDMEKELWDKSR